MKISTPSPTTKITQHEKNAHIPMLYSMVFLISSTLSKMHSTCMPCNVNSCHRQILNTMSSISPEIPMMTPTTEENRCIKSTSIHTSTHFGRTWFCTVDHGPFYPSFGGSNEDCVHINTSPDSPSGLKSPVRPRDISSATIFRRRSGISFGP